MICDKCKSEFKVKRSVQQNRYFHAVVNIIAEHTGYTLEECKTLIKLQFGMYDEGINKKTGEIFYMYHSTADLTKKEFAELTEKLVTFANSYGLNILSPEEYFET